MERPDDYINPWLSEFDSLDLISDERKTAKDIADVLTGTISLETDYRDKLISPRLKTWRHCLTTFMTVLPEVEPNRAKDVMTEIVNATYDHVKGTSLIGKDLYNNEKADMLRELVDAGMTLGRNENYQLPPVEISATDNNPQFPADKETYLKNGLGLQKPFLLAFAKNVLSKDNNDLSSMLYSSRFPINDARQANYYLETIGKNVLEKGNPTVDELRIIDPLHTQATDLAEKARKDNTPLGILPSPSTLIKPALQQHPVDQQSHDQSAGVDAHSPQPVTNSSTLPLRPSRFANSLIDRLLGFRLTPSKSKAHEEALNDIPARRPSNIEASVTEFPRSARHSIGLKALTWGAKQTELTINTIKKVNLQMQADCMSTPETLETSMEANKDARKAIKDKYRGR